MRTFAKLFGRSPFLPLQTHMDKVIECVAKAFEALEQLFAGQHDRLEELAQFVSRLEHDADRIKDDIRNHLPKGMFLPIDRASLLEILSKQDSIADKAENIAVLLTFKKLTVPDAIRADFRAFVDKNNESVKAVAVVVRELELLMESGFGGAEAERVKRLVSDVALKEHEADVIQRRLLKTMLSREEDFTYGEFFLWTRLLAQVADLSNFAEKLGNVIRMTLEIK
ncbi:MAG: TIGR00153 family protein [Phycisphaeraceae bacterium]